MEKVVPAIKLVLCKHRKDDQKIKVFAVPGDHDVEAGDHLVCNTVKKKREPCFAVSDSFPVPLDYLDNLLDLIGTDRDHLRPITGRFEEKQVSPTKTHDRVVPFLDDDDADVQLQDALRMAELFVEDDEPEEDDETEEEEEPEEDDEDVGNPLPKKPKGADDPAVVMDGVTALLTGLKVAKLSVEKMRAAAAEIPEDDKDILDILKIMNEQLFEIVLKFSLSTVAFNAAAARARFCSGDKKE